MTASMANNISIVNSSKATIEGGSVQDNISYTGQTNSFMAIWGGKDNWFDGVKEITKLESDPFEGGTFDLTNGKFVPAAAYASYGAQR